MNSDHNQDDKDETQGKGAASGQSGEAADRAAERIEGDRSQTRREHQEDLIDEAVEETFPASDPISPKQIT